MEFGQIFVWKKHCEQVVKGQTFSLIPLTTCAMCRYVSEVAFRDTETQIKELRYDLWLAHFTFVCPVTWPMNGNEAGGDPVMIQTSPLFSCKCFFPMPTSVYQHEKESGLHQNKVTSSLVSIHRPGHWACNCNMSLLPARNKPHALRSTATFSRSPFPLPNSISSIYIPHIVLHYISDGNDEENWIKIKTLVTCWWIIFSHNVYVWLSSVTIRRN